jgi:hypothetical protein
MRAARTILLLLAAAFSSAGQLSGQQPAQVPGQGENPLTTDQHRRLAFLVGQWEEEITYADAQTDQPRGQGRWVARPAMGLYLHIQYQSNGPMGPYRAFGVMAYDREEQVYRLWWFDNAAAVGEYRGKFTDENTLVFEHSGTVEGKVFRERLTYTRVSPTEVHTRIEQSWRTAEFRPYLQAVAHRTGDAPTPARDARRRQNDRPSKEPPDRNPN